MVKPWFDTFTVRLLHKWFLLDECSVIIKFNHVCIYNKILVMFLVFNKFYLIRIVSIQYLLSLLVGKNNGMPFYMKYMYIAAVCFSLCTCNCVCVG